MKHRLDKYDIICLRMIACAPIVFATTMVCITQPTSREQFHREIIALVGLLVATWMLQSHYINLHKTRKS